jgi:hypothetical protein
MSRYAVLLTMTMAAMGVTLALHADNVAGRMLVAVSSKLERKHIACRRVDRCGRAGSPDSSRRPFRASHKKGTDL